MAGYKNNYYSLDGGLSYKTFLKHFKDQARGKQRRVIIPYNGKNSRFNYPHVQSSIVLVDLQDRNVKKEYEAETPKVEIVEPTEAERKRAVEEIRRDLEEEREVTTNRSISARNAHSSRNSRKRSSKKPPSRGVSSRVKRTKDVFD